MTSVEPDCSTPRDFLGASPKRTGRCFARALRWLALFTAGPVLAATLAGLVFDHATGRPLARATVSLLEAPSGQVIATTTAGQRGEFVLSGVPAGKYRLRVERYGYADRAYVVSQNAVQDGLINLEPEAVLHVEVSLKRLPAIEGHVLDENGVGIPGVEVVALRSLDPSQPVRRAVTDERGHYRLPMLSPGEYLVRTSPLDLPGKQVLLPTYYGGALEASSATPLALRLDRDLTGIDICPSVAPYANLEGRLDRGSAEAVLLRGPLGMRRVPVQAGRFTAEDLVPGDYTLLVEPELAGGLTAYQRIHLQGGEKYSLVLQLRPAPQLDLRCESVDREPVSLGQVALFLRQTGVEGHPRRVDCNQLATLPPGEWELAAATGPGIYVAGLGGAEGAGVARISLVPGTRYSLTVLLDDQPAALRGRVLPASSGVRAGWVWVSSLDPFLRAVLGGYRQVKVDFSGRYEIAGLPPGEYVVLATESYPPGAIERWSAEGGVLVRLRRAEELELDLVSSDP